MYKGQVVYSVVDSMVNMGSAAKNNVIDSVVDSMGKVGFAAKYNVVDSVDDSVYLHETLESTS